MNSKRDDFSHFVARAIENEVPFLDIRILFSNIVKLA